jgi:hypothetical protein
VTTAQNKGMLTSAVTLAALELFALSRPRHPRLIRSAFVPKTNPKLRYIESLDTVGP